MADHIDYSVVIRTIGKAGEKYQRLLDSIRNLEPQPKEVLVVLPEGYALPEERLGYETFLLSQKGMVRQRLKGLDYCKTPYALFCDDDVCFGQDFVEKLYKPIEEGLGSFSAGPLYSFLPKKYFHAIIDCVMGTAAPTFFHRDRYVSVLRTTGYSYNRHLNNIKPYYETQSLPWTCFFADVRAFRMIKLEEEIWLDAKGYAAMDDQTMFYKAWLKALKTIVVTDAEYEHLDAKTSTSIKTIDAPYSLRFNRVIFWHRFIYNQQKNFVLKLWSRGAFAYRRFWDQIYDYVCYRRGRFTEEQYSCIKKAYGDGFKYLQEEEYKDLPDVI